MNCSKCGALNEATSKFCVKCGAPLNQSVPVNNIETPTVDTQSNISMPLPNQEPTNITNNNINNNVSNNVNSNINTNTVVQDKFNYFKYMLHALLKPVKSYKDEENNLSKPKISLIFSLIVIAIMTLINFLIVAITTIRTMNYSFTDGLKYTWDFSKLKDINYIQVIGKNFLVYAIIIFAIAAIYYVASLVIKKGINFIKGLSITTTAIIPVIAGTLILAPIASMIWVPLAMIFIVVSFAYAILIFYDLINKELNLDGDKKIYFNLACLSVIIIAAYFLIITLLVGSLGSIGSLL